jgi:hypothetical protein
MIILINQPIMEVQVHLAASGLHQLDPKICQSRRLDSERQVAAGSESTLSPHRWVTKGFRIFALS